MNIIRRVPVVVCFFFVVLLSCYAGDAAATCSGVTCTTQSEALALCTTEMNAHPTYITNFPSQWKCSVQTSGFSGVPNQYPNPPNCALATNRYSLGYYQTGTYLFYWCAGNNANPCTTQLHATSGMFPGKHFLSDTVGVNVTDPDSGGIVSCIMQFSSTGVPTLDQNGWETYGTLTPTGDINSGDPSWKPDGGPGPDPLPPNDDTPPPICGGSSCYDPGSDQYCATSGGQQYCVAGSTGRGGGACSGVVCAGQGGAGSGGVPTPSPGLIPDPSAGLSGVDNFTQGDPVTRGTTITTIVTYTPPGSSPTSSGGGSSAVSTGGTPGPGEPPSSGGSTGLPPSGSSSGGCTAGPICNDQYIGAPCGADPVTEGDPLLGATVTELHKIRCNDQTPSASDLQSATAGKYDWDQTHTADEVFPAGASSSDSGVTGLDDSGFLGGSSTCPGFKPIKYLNVNIIDSSGICTAAAMLRSYVLAMAYALGAIIIYRGKAGA